MIENQFCQFQFCFRFSQTFQNYDKLMHWKITKQQSVTLTFHCSFLHSSSFSLCHLNSLKCCLCREEFFSNWSLHRRHRSLVLHLLIHHWYWPVFHENSIKTNIKTTKDNRICFGMNSKNNLSNRNIKFSFKLIGKCFFFLDWRIKIESIWIKFLLFSNSIKTWNILTNKQ